MTTTATPSSPHTPRAYPLTEVTQRRSKGWREEWLGQRHHSPSYTETIIMILKMLLYGKTTTGNRKKYPNRYTVYKETHDFKLYDRKITFSLIDGRVFKYTPCVYIYIFFFFFFFFFFSEITKTTRSVSVTVLEQHQHGCITPSDPVTPQDFINSSYSPADPAVSECTVCIPCVCVCVCAHVCMYIHNKYLDIYIRCLVKRRCLISPHYSIRSAAVVSAGQQSQSPALLCLQFIHVALFMKLSRRT